ncbi:MAG TPA: CoA transferase, partial [Myxococcota bacterium]|nr:CoA transferase [Myxococcota bacterium]
VTASTEGLRRLKTPTRHPDAPPSGPAPLLGEHTREVLRELGLDESEIEALIQRKVIKDTAR